MLRDTDLLSVSQNQFYAQSATEASKIRKPREGTSGASEAKKLTIRSHTMLETFLIFSSYYKSRHHSIDAFVFSLATVATRSTAPTGRIVVEHSVVGIAV